MANLVLTMRPSGLPRPFAPIAVCGSPLPTADRKLVGLSLRNCTEPDWRAEAPVAAVSAQVFESAKAANGVAIGLLGAAFLLRALGDSDDDVAWLSWLSPIGWAQQVRPFGGDRWWVVGGMVVVTILLLALGSQVIGQGLLVYALGVVPPLVVGLALLTQPAISAVIGWLVYGEMLTPGDLIGAAAIATALVLVRLRPGPRATN